MDALPILFSREGLGLFNALCNVGALGLALSCTLRKAGVSDEAASVLESARDVLRLPELCDIKAIFNRPRKARALSRGVAPKGVQPCTAPPGVAPENNDSLP